MGEPTDVERLEREINRFDLASRWAEELAHEIKNPFHAMVINLELVRRRVGDAEGLRDRADVVESELHRVHGLIDSLLQIVRPWPPTATADVDAVLEALLPAVRARATLHHIRLEYEPGAGRVAMPPADLAQVVLNLIDNAIDALSEDETLRIHCTRAEDVARIELGDDGPGLAIGDPFAPGTTGREDRAGLGLAVARRLVDRAGGSIETAPGEGGRGITIDVTVPLPPA